MAVCQKCLGCGKVANSNGEPWSMWEDLPEQSKLAIRLGIVSPIECPECSGAGIVGPRGNCDECNGTGIVGRDHGKPLTCFKCRGTGTGVSWQPMPKPGKESVTEAVMADLRAREQKGIATYGTTLQTHNGRDALQGAYEEALDLAQYLKQAIMERDGVTRDA